MSFDVGDVATLTYTLTVAGAPTDATVTLNVTAPDGTVSTPAVTHTGLGLYEADIPATQAGRWYYTWTASGAATDVENGAYSVGGPITLAEAKEYLRFERTTNDAKLQKFIDQTVAEAEARLGPLTPVVRTERHNGGSDTIVLREPRAVALISVAFADGSSPDLSTFDLDPESGVVYRTYGQPCFPYGSRSVTVTYKAGWSPVPPDVKEGLLELLRFNWETQQGSNQGARPGFSEQEDVQQQQPWEWPPRTQQLLAPYVTAKVL